MRVQALRSNPRIKGLYLYVSTSTPEVLARRQKQRLAEAPSTLAKKLAWAQQQVAKSSTPALYDAVIPNTSLDEVCVCRARRQERRQPEVLRSGPHVMHARAGGWHAG
jgi:guanylate kinase